MDEDYEYLRDKLKDDPEALVRLNHLHNIILVADKLAEASLLEKDAREMGHEYTIKKAWERQYAALNNYLPLRGRI